MKEMKKDSVLKFALSKFKLYKKELITIIVVATLGSILAAVIPYIYGRLFDLALIPNTTISLLLSLVAIWAVLGLISNYTATRTSAMGDTLGAKVSLTSESEAYGHFLTLPISFHKKRRIGTIFEKISRCSWNIQSLIETVADIFPQFLVLVFALIAMFLIQWQLALIVIFSFIIYAFVTIKMTKPLIKIQQKMHEVFETQYGNVYDKLYNVFLIKNFAMEEKEKKEFLKSLLVKIIPTYKRSAEKWERMSFWQGVIYNISFVIVLSAAIFFLRSGSITQGEFIMFFGYINLAFSPFFRLSNVYRLYKRSSVAIKRLVRLKNLVPEAMVHGDKKLKDVKGDIAFKNITFGYLKNKNILKNVNFSVKAGETVALVGESGVGKTTLAELIIGYYKPKKGKIFLDKVDISEFELKWLREQIAIVPQEISLFYNTVENNLKYANPKANREKIIEACKEAFAHNFIMQLPKGYKTFVGERGVKLSVGQKQRIAIAMAFLKNPSILILDEPTAALDPETEKQVQKGIKNLIAGRTTFIIAHRLSTVREADKIIVLEKGRVVEIGNHQQLMKKKGIYYNFYTLQRGFV